MVYCWYDFPRTLTSLFSFCVKVSPSLWSALLSASQLEKEGFKATPAINSKKQSFRSLNLLFSFLSMFWYISDLGFLFLKKKKNHVYLSFVLLKTVFLLFLRTCSFPLSFFLLHPFSAFKYHISYHFNFLFLFSLCSIAHYLSTFPLIFFLCFPFVLFYRHFSCSQL